MNKRGILTFGKNDNATIPEGLTWLEIKALCKPMELQVFLTEKRTLFKGDRDPRPKTFLIGVNERDFWVRSRA
jgi:hypothetical protein